MGVRAPAIPGQQGTYNVPFEPYSTNYGSVMSPLILIFVACFCCPLSGLCWAGPSRRELPPLPLLRRDTLAACLLGADCRRRQGRIGNRW